MCGLFGASGHITYGVEKALKDLTIIDTIRGSDSTGFGIVSRDKPAQKSHIFKRVLNGAEFVDYHDVHKLFGNNRKAILGHNRAATLGEVTPDNAHPFVVRSKDTSRHTQHLMGMHNGTLSSSYITSWEKTLGEEFGTDSELLLNMISHFGPEEVLNDLKGSYALVWWDFDQDCLFFARNDQRPFHFAYSEDKGTLVWASEPEMLRLAMKRNKSVGMSDNGKVWWTVDHKIYRFDPPKATKDQVEAPRIVASLKKQEPKVAVTRVYIPANTANKGGQSARPKPQTSSTTSVPTSKALTSSIRPTPKVSQSNSPVITDMLKGVNLDVVNGHACSCVNCDTLLDKGEGYQVSEFWGKDQFVCGECLERKEVQGFFSVA